MPAVMHCGAKAVTRHQLYDVATPAPTDTHHPIPHHHFVNLAEDVMRRNNLDIVETKMWLDKGGDRFFGLYSLATGGPATLCSTIALRNAHDKAFRASMALGMRVFVCDNLSFAGDVVIGRKHTSRIMDVLPDLMDAGFHKLEAVRDVQTKRIEAYRDRYCPRTSAAEIILDAIDCDAMKTTKAKQAWQLYHDDPLSWNNGASPNMWLLYNAITMTWNNSPNQLMTTAIGRSHRLHQLIDAWCQFKPGVIEYETDEDSEVLAA